MKDEVAPRKLMLIAVDVENGGVKEPDPSDPYPRVISVDTDDYEAFIDRLGPKAGRSRKANNHHEPYDNGPASYVATVMHTHHSPGCTWIIINGWPFCIG